MLAAGKTAFAEFFNCIGDINLNELLAVGKRLFADAFEVAGINHDSSVNAGSLKGGILNLLKESGESYFLKSVAVFKSAFCNDRYIGSAELIGNCQLFLVIVSRVFDYGGIAGFIYNIVEALIYLDLVFFISYFLAFAGSPFFLTAAGGKKGNESN